MRAQKVNARQLGELRGHGPNELVVAELPAPGAERADTVWTVATSGRGHGALRGRGGRGGRASGELAGRGRTRALEEHGAAEAHWTRIGRHVHVRDRREQAQLGRQRPRQSFPRQVPAASVAGDGPSEARTRRGRSRPSSAGKAEGVRNQAAHASAAAKRPMRSALGAASCAQNPVAAYMFEHEGAFSRQYEYLEFDATVPDRTSASDATRRRARKFFAIVRYTAARSQM